MLTVIATTYIIIILIDLLDMILIPVIGIDIYITFNTIRRTTFTLFSLVI